MMMNQTLDGNDFAIDGGSTYSGGNREGYLCSSVAVRALDQQAVVDSLPMKSQDASSSQGCKFYHVGYSAEHTN